MWKNTICILDALGVSSNNVRIKNENYNIFTNFIRPKSFPKITCIRNTQSRLSDSQGSFRTEPVEEPFDKKNLTILAKVISGKFCLIDWRNLSSLKISKLTNRQLKKVSCKSCHYRSTNFWAENTFVDW